MYGLFCTKFTKAYSRRFSVYSRAALPLDCANRNATEFVEDLTVYGAFQVGCILWHRAGSVLECLETKILVCRKHPSLAVY